MKKIINVSVLTVLFSSFLSLFVEAASLQCVNVAHSKVTFSMNTADQFIRLNFGKGSDGSNLESDIANKAVTVRLDKSASHNGWSEYSGQVKTEAFQDYRTIQVRFQTADLNKKPMRVLMSPSNAHVKDGDAYTFYQFEMSCK